MEALLDSYGLLALAFVLTFKAAGVPIPVPGDALLLIAAAWAAEGRYPLWLAFGLLLAAVVLGGFLEFATARGPGRRILYRLGRVLRLTPERLDAAVEVVRHRGPLGLAAAIFTPGVRIVTIAACGLAALPLRRFVPGLVLGSTVDLSLHFAIGYMGWPLVAALWGALPAPVLVLVALLLLGLAAWLLLARLRHPRASGAEVAGEALRGWRQASCPACLVVGALRRVDLPVHAHPHAAPSNA